MIQVEEECREVAGQGEGVGEQEDEGEFVFAVDTLMVDSQMA